MDARTQKYACERMKEEKVFTSDTRRPRRSPNVPTSSAVEVIRELTFAFRTLVTQFAWNLCEQVQGATQGRNGKASASKQTAQSSVVAVPIMKDSSAMMEGTD